MTREAFLEALRSRGIRPDAVSFDGGGDECYVVVCRGGRWDVYYSERGLQTNLRHFDSEPAALDALMERLCADPSTRAGS